MSTVDAVLSEVVTMGWPRVAGIVILIVESDAILLDIVVDPDVASV